METRANYVLIGAFTLAGILGTLGLILWLAKVEVDRQFDYYEIRFESVSGLGAAGAVRYNGLPVGQVLALRLDEDDPSRVRVRIEVDAATPIKTDTVATLEMQGVTGVAYVSLTGGSPDAALLEDVSDDEVPVIESQRSAIQSVFQGAPELLEKAIALLEDVREVVSPENKAAVTAILGNLESASGEIEAVAKDFSKLSGDISTAASGIAGFTEKLEPLAATTETTMKSADETLRAATDAIKQSEATIDAATEALKTARKTFESADTLIATDLPKLVDQVDSTAETIETVVADVGGKAGSVVEKTDAVAAEALARLQQAEQTLAALDGVFTQANTTMAAIELASKNVDTLISGEGAALVADARTALQNANQTILSVNQTVEADLPLIIADVRAASASVKQTVETVGADLTAATGRIDGLAVKAEAALVEATRTFKTANDTLQAVTKALDTAEGALIAAEQTFVGAARVINEDMDAIVKDVRNTTQNLDAALAVVARDLPIITADVKSAAARTEDFVAGLDRIVDQGAPQVDAFLKAGLPQFIRFVQESRSLVANLQRLTAKIESDPARFILGTQTPEFQK